VGTYFIYAVFVLGLVLVLMSDDIWSFGDTWIWLSMLLYLVGIGLSHGVQQPSVRRMIALMEEMGAPGRAAAGPRATSAGGRDAGAGHAAWATGAALNVLLVVLLYLMVLKPGA
jgi:hypothetical protein